MGILKTNNEQIALMDTIHKYICVNIRKNIDPLKNIYILNASQCQKAECENGRFESERKANVDTIFGKLSFIFNQFSFNTKSYSS